MPRASLLAILLLGLACNSTKKTCEQARDAFASEWERASSEAMKDVPPEYRAKLEAEGAKEVARLREVFVEVCLRQPEATHECLGRIDELLEAERARRAALQKCGFEDRACIDAVPSAESTVGECGPGIQALLDGIVEG